MQVLVNTDHNIDGREAMAEGVRQVVEGALRHFSDHITRVEVHVSDQNGAKGGPDDKRCVMEARLEGRPPIAVTHDGPTVESVVAGAADNLVKRIEGILGRAARSHGLRE